MDGGELFLSGRSDFTLRSMVKLNTSLAGHIFLKEVRTMATPRPPEHATGHDATAPPLAGLTFSIVGPGRVGISLGHWLRSAGALPVSVAGRAPGSSGRRRAAELAADWASVDTLASADQDLLLLAVPDDALEDVAATLARRPQARHALHCSGSRPAAVLAALADTGCATGSLHPLRAFPAVLADPRAGRSTWFGIDGDPAALRLAHRLAEGIGGRAVEVGGDARILYHLAATLAAGGVVTLLAAAMEVVERLELPPELLEAYLALARGALDQVERSGDPAAAVTGPAARGDHATLERHRRALAATLPELGPLVDELVRTTLRLAAAEASAGPPEEPTGRRRTLPRDEGGGGS